MALDAFLIIDGIVGEPAAHGGIAVQAWSFGETNSGDVTGPGLVVQTVTIQSDVGVHSVPVVQLLQTQVSKPGYLDVFTNNNESFTTVPPLKFVFTGILFTSYQVGGVGTDPYQEQITFSFSSVSMQAHGLQVVIPPIA
jgi:hypothetical protein